MMETSLEIKSIGFKISAVHRSLFFSLLFLQLHLLFAVSQNSIVGSADQGNIGGEPKVSRKLLLSVNLVGKHETRAFERDGGSVGSYGGSRGGEHGGVGGNASGGKTEPSNKRGGALIPVYTAGAANRNRHRQQTQHQHRSNSDTINCIGSSCLVLILFTSFSSVYFM